MLNPVRKLTDNMGGDEDQSIGFEPEEESTNFYHPGFGIKVALRNYAPVPHLLPILRHLRGNLFSFYRGKIQKILEYNIQNGALNPQFVGTALLNKSYSSQ